MKPYRPRTALPGWNLRVAVFALLVVPLSLALLTLPVTAVEDNLDRVLGTIEGIQKATQLYKAGKSKEALPLAQSGFKSAREIWGLEGFWTLVSINTLAAIYRALGKTQEALQLWQLAAKVAVKVQEKGQHNVALVIKNLATQLLELQFYDLALPLYLKALAGQEKEVGPMHPSVAVTCQELATVYRELGIFDKALSNAQRALEISRNMLGPNHQETLASMEFLANLYLFMGDWDEALARHQEILKMRREILPPDSPDLASSFNNLATIYLAFGDYDRALVLFQEAVAIIEKHADLDGSLRGVQENLGNLYLLRKDYPQAEACYLKANFKESLTELYLATGRYSQALDLLKTLAVSWRTTRTYQVQYYTQLGEALKGLKRPAAAAVAFSKAVQLIEAMRAGTKAKHTGFFRGGYFGGFSRPYTGLISVLTAIKAQDLPPELQAAGPQPEAAAFYFAEATKGRALLEGIARAAKKTLAPQIPADLAQKEKELLDQLRALEVLWEEHYQGGEQALEQFKKQRDNLQQELAKLVTELRKTYPRYAALEYPQPLKPKEVPLEKDEILLEYVLGDKESYLFRVEPGGATRVFVIPVGREALEQRVGAMLAPLRKEELTGDDLKPFFMEAAAQLYRDILAPALEGVNPGTRLIIVPDGVLGAFPFEALVVEAGTGWGDSVPVADRWPVTYSQSAAILALNRFLPKRRAEFPLFALGDCIYDKKSPRYLAYREGRGQAGELREPGRELALTMGSTQISWGKKVFASLPQTREAVAELAALFNQPLKPPQVLLDVLATETGVKKIPLDRYRHLFFGTHGDLTDKTQGLLQPVLILTQVENEPPDDGNLTFTEVLNLKLDADLVTLAACLTGVGQVMQGEGVQHMARAFQQAGARAVMVALWKIPVKESLLFYRTFYQALKDGKSRLAALEAARQAVRAENPHPFFWGGLILHGEG
jgi:CHAT domain-containing protein